MQQKAKRYGALALLAGIHPNLHGWVPVTLTLGYDYPADFGLRCIRVRDRKNANFLVHKMAVFCKPCIFTNN
jgi:hypothetical protein